ncbi:PKD domain-containing protein, partial [Psychroserpens luteus]
MKKALLIIFTLFSFSTYAQDIIMQNGSVTGCSGTFYDSGGAGGAYSSGEALVLTICPDNPGQLVTLDFTAFSTQLGVDVMTIYNGDSTASPVFGTFDGANSPGSVTATEDNGSGCLTIQFDSDAAGTTTGWAADVSCFTPCQTVVSQLDSATPAPNGDGYIRVCPGEDITLTGSGVFEFDGTGATYEWDLGDGNIVAGQTATFSYDIPGVYIVNLNTRDANTDSDPLGCANTNLINQVIQVATEPSFSGTGAANTDLCFGETTTIDGVVTPTLFANDCTPPVSGTTFLPDGSGAVYTTCITVDCFESDQLLTDVNQLLDICINMEHSYSGDLDIRIISPNGQEADLFTQAGGGTYFGGANDDTSNNPGVGADYCFSMSATTLLQNANTITAGTNPPNSSWTPGTYLPIESFASLIGSPLNGDWCIEIVDNLSIDNGYVFSWGLNFDPNIQPPELSFTPVITSEGWDADPSITNITGSTITVAPLTAGTHCYTYRVTDDFGCEYTQEVCIDMAEDITADSSPVTATICDGEDAVFNVTGTPNALITYTLNGGAIQTVVLDGTGNGTVTVTAPAVDQTLNVIDATIGTPDIIGNAQTAIGGFDTDNATGPIDPVGTAATNANSVTITSAEPLLTLTLEDNVPVGTDITISLAKDNVTGDMVISDGVANLTYNTGAEDVLQQIIFTTGASTNTLTFTQNAGQLWIDGVEYTLPGTSCTVVIDDTETITVGEVFDTNFTMTPTCDGGTATVTGDIGGVFSFVDPQPTDGADIDSVTGTIIDGVSNTTYTVIYEFASACSPGTTQTVTVLPSGDATFTLTPTCDGATVTIIGDTGGIFAFNPIPTDGADIDLNTGTITDGVQGSSYTVEYLVAGACPALSSQSVTVLPFEDASFTLTSTCLGATAVITGDTGGTFVFNPLPTDGAVIDENTGLITGVSGTVYTVEYMTSGPCPETSSESVTVFPSEDASFTYMPNCTGATATVTGDTGGVFTFNPVPTDGALIDSDTGEITNGVPGATYTVDHITSGNCPATVTQTITVFAEDDSSFNLIPTCDGAIATVTGLPGGTFTFNPNPGNGATINSATGAITGGPFDAVYTIDYTTDNGTCPTTTTQSVTSYSQPIVIDPTPLEVCDDGTPDGITSIDLTLKNVEITDNNPNYSVSYHIDLLDAQNNANPLDIPYTNTIDGQIVVVRVQDINTGCYNTTTLELIVQQAPIANTPTALEYCDPDSDGFGEFDLESKNNEITGGDPSLTVSYHETMADAINNVNSLTSLYNNIVEDMQTVYARVESSTIATNCATIVELVLIVNPTPQLGAGPTALEVCDDLSADGI